MDRGTDLLKGTLEGVDKLEIRHARRGWCQELLCCQFKSDFKYYHEGKKVAESKEEFNAFCRCCLGPCHSYDMTIKAPGLPDDMKPEIIEIARPCRLPMASCKCCCHQEATIFSGLADLGEVRETFWCLYVSTELKIFLFLLVPVLTHIIFLFPLAVSQNSRCTIVTMRQYILSSLQLALVDYVLISLQKKNVAHMAVCFSHGECIRRTQQVQPVVLLMWVKCSKFQRKNSVMFTMRLALSSYNFQKMLMPKRRACFWGHML